jgi:ABC-type transporter Mla subunit MlaD
MAETTINVVNALQGQQAQLKRLIAQKRWISDAPKAMLTEIDAQITQIQALLAELERDIQDQMKGS